MKKIEQNRYIGEFVEYGVLSALFDMYPESQVGLVAPNAQAAFDAAKEYLAKLHGTKRMKAILLPRRPSRITNATHQLMIDHFNETGSSQHSQNATMLQYVIDYCEENKIAYRVTCVPGAGYIIEKAPELQAKLEATMARITTHVQGAKGIGFLKKLLKKHPKLYLYYHDNSSWILYKEKPPEDTYSGDPAHDKLVLAEGGGMDSGYVPDIVQLLCDAVGIEVDSA